MSDSDDLSFDAFVDDALSRLNEVYLMVDKLCVDVTCRKMHGKDGDTGQGFLNFLYDDVAYYRDEIGKTYDNAYLEAETARIRVRYEKGE